MVSFCKAAVEYKSTHRWLICGQCLCCLGKSTLRGVAAQLCDRTLSKHKEAFVFCNICWSAEGKGSWRLKSSMLQYIMLEKHANIDVVKDAQRLF